MYITRGKTQKLLAKSYRRRARGLNGNRFGNWLGMRGVGAAQSFYIYNIFYVTLGS
tara:strand:- start:80 stop:247 length:168 start_codon:yes stop_codon:yes gene_type:complete